MMRVFWEAGPDCLWVVSENPDQGLFDRRAFYPWDSTLLAELHSEAEWLEEALEHLTGLAAEGEA